MIVSGSGGFPKHGAYANRIMSMAKGLSLITTTSVELWIPFLGQHSLQYRSGKYEGIKFQYCVNNSVRPNRFTKYGLHIVGSISSTIRLIRYSKQYDVILSFVHGILLMPLWLVAIIYKIPIARELNEYPNNVIARGNTRINLWQRIHVKAMLGPFNGFIVISKSLKEFLCTYFPSTKCLILPINVQPESFRERKTTKHSYITYTGSISCKKDGIDLLIRAFSLLVTKHKNIRLRLVGGFGNQEDEFIVHKLLEEFGISELVDLTGWVDREIAVGFILEAHILVLSRPRSIQAQGGFPTKLGEYLASGIPTLVTMVGDIPEYLTGGLNVFFAEPGNLHSLVEQMDYILLNYDEAMAIAKRGREVALSEFDYRVQATKLNDFLISVIQKR